MGALALVNGTVYAAALVSLAQGPDGEMTKSMIKIIITGQCKITIPL